MRNLSGEESNDFEKDMWLVIMWFSLYRFWRFSQKKKKGKRKVFCFGFIEKSGLLNASVWFDNYDIRWFGWVFILFLCFKMCIIIEKNEFLIFLSVLYISYSRILEFFIFIFISFASSIPCLLCSVHLGFVWFLIFWVHCFLDSRFERSNERERSWNLGLLNLLF